VYSERVISIFRYHNDVWTGVARVATSPQKTSAVRRTKCVSDGGRSADLCSPPGSFSIERFVKRNSGQINTVFGRSETDPTRFERSLLGFASRFPTGLSTSARPVDNNNDKCSYTHARGAGMTARFSVNFSCTKEKPRGASRRTDSGGIQHAHTCP